MSLSPVESFAQSVRALAADASYAATEAETLALVRAVIQRSKATSVATAGIPPQVMEVIGPALKEVRTVRVEELKGGDAKSALAGVELGITWAAFGLVKEGALLEVTSDDAVKLTSCLPMVHLALLSEGSLIQDFTAGMKEAGRIVAESCPPKPIISFITGPSKTADIESKLLYGVHGPHSLSVAVLGWI